MLLTVDVGNSETVVGLFQGKELVHHWRLTSSRRQTGDELGVLLVTVLGSVGVGAERVEGIAVSSVVPELIHVYREMGERTFHREPLIIDHRAMPDLRILNLDPATVGPDRLVNAVAAVDGHGAPAIVVDLGTATTFDVIDASGAYAGGVIAPGILIAAHALFDRGARLGRVEVKAPARVVGRSTEESLQSGIFFGAVAAVDGLVRRIIAEQKFPAGVPVIATGGLATAVQEASETITAVDPTLTLTGIRLVWEKQARR
jgi:type III pantothenate kinase